MRKVGQRENESFNSTREKIKSRVSLAHKIYDIRLSGPFRVHAEELSGKRQSFYDEPLTGVLMPT